MMVALRLVAPGTQLREGLDRILQARMGALIVVGDGPDVLSVCSGGFLSVVRALLGFAHDLDGFARFAAASGDPVLNRWVGNRGARSLPAGLCGPR